MYSIFYIMKKINLNISEKMDEEQIILIEQYNKLIKQFDLIPGGISSSKSRSEIAGKS